MRSVRPFLVLLFAAALITAAGALAQDPVKVNPDIYKVSFENDRVRVNEIVFKPGAKIGMHSHPDHFMYIQAPGKIKITRADGTSTDGDFKTGQIVWIAAESHSAVNTGTTELRALVVELKPLPAKK